MVAAIVWVVAAIGAVVLEVFTVDLIFALIAVGAGTAAVAALLGAPLWLQAVIGVGVSALGIAFVRPVAMRHLKKTAVGARTGVDALPGSRGSAMTEITARDGRIRLRGEVWSARLDETITSEPVPSGVDVVVTRIDGATALVHPVDPY